MGSGGRKNFGGQSWHAGGGAGWLSDGTAGRNETNYNFLRQDQYPQSAAGDGGRTPLNGGEGGARWDDSEAPMAAMYKGDEGGDGGFGGGGGGGSDNMGAGGGGGYSGGGGARGWTNNYAGGGGGSYCVDQPDGECDVDENEWELNEGHGKVIITVME